MSRLAPLALLVLLAAGCGGGPPPPVLAEPGWRCAERRLRLSAR